MAYIKDAAEELGLANQINIMVGSDFGRTTYYNGQSQTAGKDHHSVTSWLTMLWGSRVENGVRVIGETDDSVIARGLTPDLTPAGPGQGVVMTPAIIHNNLRRLAGVDGAAIGDRFGLGLQPNEAALRLWA